MNTALLVNVFDQNDRALKAEVTCVVTHRGKPKTLGPVETLGFADAPVSLYIPSDLDSSVVVVTAKYGGVVQTEEIDTANRHRISIRLHVEIELSTPTGAGVGTGGHDALATMIALLDGAVRKVRAARYAWGIVAVAAAATIVNFLLGLNRLSFATLVATFVGMILFYIFARVARSNDLITRLAGQILILVTVAAFTVFVAASLSAGLACRPRAFVYLFGLEEPCTDPGRRSDVRAVAASSPGSVAQAEKTFRYIHPNGGGGEVCIQAPAGKRLDVDRLEAEPTAKTLPPDGPLYRVPTRENGDIIVKPRNDAYVCVEARLGAVAPGQSVQHTDVTLRVAAPIID